MGETVERKAVRIEIEYDDGTIEFALDKDAAYIVGWYNSCEVFVLTHGARYQGPFLQKRRVEPAPGDSGAGEDKQ